MAGVAGGNTVVVDLVRKHREMKRIHDNSNSQKAWMIMKCSTLQVLVTRLGELKQWLKTIKKTRDSKIKRTKIFWLIFILISRCSSLVSTPSSPPPLLSCLAPVDNRPWRDRRGRAIRSGWLWSLISADDLFVCKDQTINITVTYWKQ